MSNNGKKWSVVDTKYIMKQVKNKIDIEDIASELGRSYYGVYMKILRELAKIIEYSGDDITLEELSEISNLSKQEIIDGLKFIKCDISHLIHYDKIDIVQFITKTTNKKLINKIKDLMVEEQIYYVYP